MVLFPELSLTGYSIKDMNWDLAMNLDRAIPILQPLVDVSKEISIIAGGVEEDSSFRIYNSAFLMEDGVIRSAHRKTYPPTYGLFEEMRYFSKGNTIRAIDVLGANGRPLQVAGLSTTMGAGRIRRTISEPAGAPALIPVRKDARSYVSRSG